MKGINNTSAQRILDEILFGSQQYFEMMAEKSDIDEAEEEEVFAKKRTRTTTVISPRELSIARRKTARRKAAKKNQYHFEKKEEPYYTKPRRRRRVIEESFNFEFRRAQLTDITLNAALEEYYEDVACKQEVEAEIQEVERMRQENDKYIKRSIAFCKIRCAVLEGDIQTRRKILAMDEELYVLPKWREYSEEGIKRDEEELCNLRKRIEELEKLKE